MLLLAVLVICTGAAPYMPRQQVGGTIRIWGLHTMRGVVERLAEGFRTHHPGARFELTMKGSATAIPGLYAGKADIAFLARPNNLVDDNGFGRVKQYAPLRLEVMSGSLDTPGKADALAVLVHHDNPIHQLTLAQLDAMFGCERRRGHPPIRIWGDLGLGGEWRDKPIALHVYDADTGKGIYFQNTVLNGSRKMDWSRIREYRNARNSDGTSLPAAEQIAREVRRDRYALGIGSLHYAHPELKSLALAGDSVGPFVHATTQSIVSGEYPLARRAYAFVDRKPGSLDASAAEFLRFVLSEGGQAIIAREGGFLPLSDAARLAQANLLEEAAR